MIDITKENKVIQEITLDLSGDDKQNFFKQVKKFVEKNTPNKIEGEIKNVYLISQYNGNLHLSVKSLKEDKLKAIEYKETEK